MPRDAIGLIAFAAFLGVLLALGGCAASRVTCPYGTYPVRDEATSTSTGNASGEVSIPARGGKVGAAWGGSDAHSTRCLPICPKGTAIEASESGDGKRQLRCIDLNCPTRDGGAP